MLPTISDWIDLSWRIDPDGSLGIRRFVESKKNPGTRLTTDEYYGYIFEESVPGLPEKAQENLFRAFQGAARKGGSGLGLAISAELVRGHGGRLELQGTGAKGTSFLIVLPKTTAALDAAAE